MNLEVVVMREDKEQLTNDPRVECFDREAGWYEGWTPREQAEPSEDFRPLPPMQHPTVPGYDIDDPKAIRLAMFEATGRW